MSDITDEKNLMTVFGHAMNGFFETIRQGQGLYTFYPHFDVFMEFMTDRINMAEEEPVLKA